MSALIQLSKRISLELIVSLSYVIKSRGSNLQRLLSVLFGRSCSPPS